MKLQIKDAKLFLAMLVLGILLTLGGCLLPNTLRVLRIILLICGVALMWTMVIWSKKRFKCPHCGLANITPRWKQEAFCPVCGKQIHWE